MSHSASLNHMYMYPPRRQFPWLAVLIGLFMIVSGVALGLSIYAAVKAAPSSSTPVERHPYPVPSGLYCSFPPAEFATLAPDCGPDPPSAINETYCAMSRQQSDFACVRAACAQLIYFNSSGDTLLRIGFVDPTYIYIDITNEAVPGDGGPIRMENLMKKYMADNADGAPGPFDETVTYNVASYEAETTFANAAGELGRQYAAWSVGYVMSWREDMATPAEWALLAYDLFAYYKFVVMTPQYCDDEALQEITWLADTNTSAFEVVYVANAMLSVNQSDTDTEPDTWVDSGCMTRIAVGWFCALFPDYYAAESIRNVSLIPSPWADLTTAMTALNNEYLNCGTPVGCTGLAAESS